MNEKELKGLMGLCVRAGQGVFGEDACLKTIRSGQAGLLILDEEISPAAAEKYARACGREAVPTVRVPGELLESATGRPGRAMAVRRGSFADRMIRCLE